MCGRCGPPPLWQSGELTAAETRWYEDQHGTTFQDVNGLREPGQSDY
jgi:hypothetical protein